MSEALMLTAIGGLLLGLMLSWGLRRLRAAWPRRPQHLVRLGVRRRQALSKASKDSTAP